MDIAGQPGSVALVKIMFMKKLHYFQVLLIICIIGLFAAGCSKTEARLEDRLLVSSPKTGVISGFISPADAKASILVYNGFFNGRETLFDAQVDSDPVTGKYVIKDIPQGTYTVEMIPTNPEYTSWKIQGLLIEPGETVCVNTCMPKR